MPARVPSGRERDRGSICDGLRAVLSGARCHTGRTGDDEPVSWGGPMPQCLWTGGIFDESTYNPRIDRGWGFGHGRTGVQCGSEGRLWVAVGSWIWLLLVLRAVLHDLLHALLRSVLHAGVLRRALSFVLLGLAPPMLVSRLLCAGVR